MTTPEKLSTASDELATAEYRLAKLHVDFAIDCDNAESDNQPIPELTDEEKRVLKSVTQELRNVLRNLETLTN